MNVEIHKVDPLIVFSILLEPLEKLLPTISQLILTQLHQLVSRGWTKKKFPSIFAYGANTVGLRSMWHLDELFFTKFSLKLCIVCICSLSGSRNICKNVFSVKLQFLRICNFFHEKKKLVKQRQVIFRDGSQEKMWFYCNFLWWFNS